MIKDKRIITNSIKYNLIPQVSSRRTPKEMFDALYILFEGRNINRNMTLKNHLKSVKAQKSKTMQSYFTRVAQIKEQLEAIGDIGDMVYHEWYSKILEMFYSMNLLKKKMDQVPTIMGRMCSRRRKNRS